MVLSDYLAVGDFHLQEAQRVKKYGDFLGCRRYILSDPDGKIKKGTAFLNFAAALFYTAFLFVCLTNIRQKIAPRCFKRGRPRFFVRICRNNN